MDRACPRRLKIGQHRDDLASRTSEEGNGLRAALAGILDAGDGTTLLKWSGAAEARGPVAGVGGRVLEAQAQKLIVQAFGNVRQQLTT